MTKSQLNVRASALTRRQLSDLIEWWGQSQTEVISTVIDRSWRRAAMKHRETIVLSEREQNQNMTGGVHSFTTGDKVTIFFDDDTETWAFCYHGVGDDGNAYEDDDITGFQSQGEAKEAAIYSAAVQKVSDNPELSDHADFILADWAEGMNHYLRVCQTPINEILDWVAAGK